MMLEKMLNREKCILIFPYPNLSSDMEKKIGLLNYLATKFQIEFKKNLKLN